MTLLDYHRLHSEEKRSWDRARLEKESGHDFVSGAEKLLTAVASKDFEACLRTTELYCAANAWQKIWLRSRMNQALAANLEHFGHTAAVRGVRTSSEPLIRAALIAYVIADLECGDLRDLLIGFTLVVHCAALAGQDVPHLLRETGALGGPAMRALFENWAKRYPDVQTIESMGWRQIETPEGIGFTR